MTKSYDPREIRKSIKEMRERLGKVPLSRIKGYRQYKKENSKRPKFNKKYIRPQINKDPLPTYKEIEIIKQCISELVFQYRRDQHLKKKGEEAFQGKEEIKKIKTEEDIEELEQRNDYEELKEDYLIEEGSERTEETEDNQDSWEDNLIP